MPLERTEAVVTFKGGVSCLTTVDIRSCCWGGGAPESHTIWGRVSVIRLYGLLFGSITDGF